MKILSWRYFLEWRQVDKFTVHKIVIKIVIVINIGKMAIKLSKVIPVCSIY